MKICKVGHEPIVYEGDGCFVCKLIGKHDKELLKLESTIESLRGKVDKLTTDLSKAWGKD